MYQLCRITLRLTWNGLNAQFVDLSGGLWGKCYVVAQLFKENSPEWEVFIHI